MDVNQSDIIELANMISSQQSFDYETFEKAKATQKAGRLNCEFDRMTLYIYSHNLTADEYELLKSLLRAKLSELNRENQKKISEYDALLAYLQYKTDYIGSAIQKCVQPDFCLSNGIVNVGIEITQFTTEQESVQMAIARQNFGRGKRAKEIQENARKMHGTKANEYKYFDIDGTAIIQSGLFDCSSRKYKYADEIKKKYDIYNGQFDKFNHFILLCDGRLATCLSYKKDSDDIIKIVKEKMPHNTGFNVAILRRDSNYTLEVDEYSL